MLTDKKILELLTKLHDEMGLDFTQYKPATVLRRISSRMGRFNMTSYDDYMALLDREPDEYSELVGALTINVTDFFRNPESFEAIDKVVIPRIVISKREHRHKIIRAWSCACSTGDEPYSLAMVFMEKLGTELEIYKLTIIGTDIDDTAIDTAKEMAYSSDKLKAINRQMLGKYFEKSGEDEFRIKPSVRRHVQFHCHDVIKDRPFMHMDVILCRNLLIYFNKQLQEETLLKLHECLNPGGYLVLGMTESLAGTAINRFENVDNRLRIYRKPEEQGLNRTNGMMSQEEIDRLVREMNER